MSMYDNANKAEYIEREEVYHKLTGVCDGYCHAKMCKFTEYMLEEIEDIPAADVQPVNMWISVDERLPQDNKEVLAYTRYSGITIASYDAFFQTWMNDECCGLEVTHWQPLPEPPEAIKSVI